MERDNRPNDGLFCHAGRKPFKAEFFRGIVPRHHRNVFNVTWLIFVDTENKIRGFFGLAMLKETPDFCFFKMYR